MVSYFKKDYKVQRNKRQSKYEKSDPIRSEQADKNMRGEIRVEPIIDGASISEQTELRGMLRIEQSRLRESGEKCG